MKKQKNSTKSLPNFGNNNTDYYIHTGTLPQCNVTNIENPVEGYPRLERLHELKRAHFKANAVPALGVRVPPSSMLSTLNSWLETDANTNFDVVLIGGCLDDGMAISEKQLESLPIPQLTPKPSILLIWVPQRQIDLAHRLMHNWGFRRSEDIAFFPRSKSSVFMPKRTAAQVESSVLIPTSWHCILGLKGTLRRSEDNALINCNVDTDVIIEKESTLPGIVPLELYSIIENFTSMARRLHIIPGYAPEDKPVRIRNGWVIVSPDIGLDNFRLKAYNGRNPRRAPFNKEVDELRPKTPPLSK